MGGRASKELSETQGTVLRLTQELQKTMKDLETNRAGATKAQELEKQVHMLTSSLQSAKKDLEFNTGQLRLAEQEKVASRKLRIQLDNVKTELERKQAEAARVEEQRKEQERINLELLQSAGRLIEKDKDPTLGELIADMGHKRVYKADPITLLAHTQVWRRQRAFRPARAEKIALSKVKSSIHGWPGTITAAYIAKADKSKEQEGSMVIIDGQHRLGACSYLESKGLLKEDLKTVTVEVYPEMHEAVVKELFMEINKCEPVLDVDLPEGGASENNQALLNGAAVLLKDKFPKMFKDSQNCRKPFVNIDRLRNELHQHDVIGKLKIEKEEDLFNWLVETNAKLGAKPESDWEGKATENQVAKARENGFYLGMDWEWLPTK